MISKEDKVNRITRYLTAIYRKRGINTIGKYLHEPKGFREKYYNWLINRSDVFINKYYEFQNDFLTKCNIKIDENYTKKDFSHIKKDFFTIITKVFELQKNNIIEIIMNSLFLLLFTAISSFDFIQN